MAKDELEGSIQSSILDYMAYSSKYKDYVFWRQNVISRYDTKRGIFFKMPKYSMNGLPDIMVVKDGFLICIEVKRKGGKQSQHQKDFEALMKDHGAEYHTVYSVDDVKEIGL